MSSRKESVSSGQDNGAGVRTKRFSFAKLPDIHSEQDAETDTLIPTAEYHYSSTQTGCADSPSKLSRKEDEESRREVKNMKYWAAKIGQVFRKVKQAKKRRRRSIDSFVSSHDSEMEDEDNQTIRFRPEAIDTLIQLTKFDRRELQLMYRGFKQECPSGMVREDVFKGIYAQFFPRGADITQYAHYVFNTFDHDHTGSITFTDFVVGLSVLARGSLREKLRWVFGLYDINGDGFITKDEMTRIVNSIYDLMGRATEPSLEDHNAKEHVERVFQKLDLNRDGVVTIDEFMDSCSNDDNIKNSMTVFDTVL
ncbi:A-type potassium channel modulatory protein KCNIP1-like [Centruroides vittatus]|uniref:A-type potassium channel modulatory protein KCNIP1-like n=1 Tax=Centruroides vittatus TaxID=120091 RepID=UPI00350EB873